MQEFSGRVAVVTGGASGIGLSMARAFAARSMRIVLADIERDALDDAVTSLTAEGAEVIGVPCDVRLPDQVDRVRDEAVDAFGAVHVVCNNAGVGTGGAMESLSLNDWSWALGVNLQGVVHGISTFLPLLKEQDEGHIVNTASVAGLFAAPFMGPYNASKFAVVAISETLYHELALAGSSVGVSVLCPAWVATGIADSERNRPHDLRNPQSEDADAAADGMRQLLQGVIAGGMSPADVADQVVDAIEERTFYILTHDDSRDAVRARLEAILDGGPPPFVMPQ